MPDILFPPGRLVGGSVDKLTQRTENNGQPKVGKDGKPEMQCSFGVAIPKGPEQHWAQASWQHPQFGLIEWGKMIYDTGAAAHPNLVASPAFSWKIIDGDSTLPNKKGKRPVDQTGYPGHWVIWFSQSWAPKRCNADGSIELPEGSIKPGYYVQVFGSVAGNKLVPNGTPGVYLNPSAVALIGEGPVIANDVNTTSVGFGSAPLPAGATPVQPAVQGFVAPTTPAVPAPVPPQVVQSRPEVLAPAAPTPPAPPVPSGPVMTAKAGNVTYEAFRSQGWSDDQLRAEGYMV